MNAAVIDLVLQNLRTHRFRRGARYALDDLSIARISKACLEIAPERLSADTAQSVLDLLEREIAPFTYYEPGPVGRVQ